MRMLDNTRHIKAAVALAAGLAVAGAHPHAFAEPAACWSPEALAGQASDRTIVKNTPQAIVAPPGQALLPHGTEPRGAIRRVELPPGDKRIALTFDMCEQPHEVAGYDAAVVGVLRELEVRATFFAGGKWMLTHAGKAQQLIADPLFEMGNHSWEHRNLRLLEGERQENEIAWAQAAYEQQVASLAERRCLARDGRIFERTQANARLRLFRFPYGACNPAALDAAARLGVVPIQWDVSSGDPTKGVSGAAMAAGVMHAVRPGSIVLFHANGRSWQTAEALRVLVPKLRAKGYAFATVGELLAAGKPVTVDTCYDSKPGDTDRHDALARSLEKTYERFLARMTKPAPPPEADQKSGGGWSARVTPAPPAKP